MRVCGPIVGTFNSMNTLGLLDQWLESCLIQLAIVIHKDSQFKILSQGWDVKITRRHNGVLRIYTNDHNIDLLQCHDARPRIRGTQVKSSMRMKKTQESSKWLFLGNLIPEIESKAPN